VDSRTKALVYLTATKHEPTDRVDVAYASQLQLLSYANIANWGWKYSPLQIAVKLS